MVAYNRQKLRIITSTKSYDFVFDKSFPISQRYQVRNINPFYIIKAFKRKIDAKEYFKLLVSQSPEREILKLMGWGYQL